MNVSIFKKVLFLFIALFIFSFSNSSYAADNQECQGGVCKETNNDFLTVNIGQTSSVNVLANDPDFDTTNISSLSDVTASNVGTAGGTVNFNFATGEFTYTPLSGEENTTVTAFYEVCSNNDTPPICVVTRVDISVLPALIDSDGDGVVDDLDLDDDNDGLWDSEEGFCEDPETGSWNISGSTAIYNYPNGLRATLTKTGNWALSNNNFNNTAESQNFWTPNLAGSPSLSSNFDWGSQLTVSFTDQAGNPVDIDNPVLHLDRLGGRSQNGYSGSVQHENTAIVTLQDGLTWAKLSGTTDFGVTANTAYDTGHGQPSNSSYTFESTQGILNGTAAGSLRLNDRVSTFVVEFVQGIGVGVGYDGIEVGLSACLATDTDGDGIPNHLDLDSDNDGCFDAIEGTAPFTSSDLENASGVVTVGPGSPATTNQNLGNAVDGDGVLNIMFSDTQNVGTSQDDTQKDSACCTLNTTEDSGTGVVGTAFTIPNILTNDSLNGNVPVIGTNLEEVSISQVGVWDTGITLDSETGEVNVSDAVPAGNYSLQYEVCVRGTVPQLCQQDFVNITITAGALITATPDSGTISSVGGEAIGNVLVNDTLNGNPATLSNVTLTQVSTTNSGVILYPTTGAVNVVAGTPAGVYTVNYEICETANLTNCDTTTATVTVSNDPINTTSDSGSVTTAGGEAISNVLANDTLGGNPATLSNVTLTQVSTTNSGVTLDPTTGAVNVVAGTPVGVYTVNYEICEIGNPTNCATEVATVTVNSNDSPVIVTHNETINQGDTLNLLDLVDSATDLEDGDVSADVTVLNDGGFDSNVPGVYTVTFTVTDSDGNTTTQTAVVTVETNDSPVIVTHNETINQGGTLNLLDLVDSATDTEDGDVSADVTVANDGGFDPNVPGVYTITFTVTDTDGNTTTQTATVTVNPVTNSPVIVTHNETINQGDTLNLLDLVDSATDLEDGDVSADVTVANDGGFDPNVPGVYTITFTVTDTDGNTTTQTATVTVRSRSTGGGSGCRGGSCFTLEDDDNVGGGDTNEEEDEKEEDKEPREETPKPGKERKDTNEEENEEEPEEETVDDEKVKEILDIDDKELDDLKDIVKEVKKDPTKEPGFRHLVKNYLERKKFRESEKNSKVLSGTMKKYPTKLHKTGAGFDY